MRYLEEGGMRKISGTAKAQAKFEKYESKSEVQVYQSAADSTIPVKIEDTDEAKEKKKKKRKVHFFCTFANLSESAPFAHEPKFKRRICYGLYI